jgi:hypothetical protein
MNINGKTYYTKLKQMFFCRQKDTGNIFVEYQCRVNIRS